MQKLVSYASLLACSGFLATPAIGAVIYNNLTPNNLIGIASRSDIPGSTEVEAADDFLLASNAFINSASFVGLLSVPAGQSFSVTNVTVEIYRVFPSDSNTARTPNVPTRANSPSDVAFDSRASDLSGLTFTTAVLNSSFTALNSAGPGGINPSPNQTTGGNGPVSGQEVQFNVTFTTPFSLPADHYFFVPQVRLASGQFFWLSASRPITGAGTTPFAPDLQAWVRDGALDPDWLRVGTDIVGQGAFNAAFSLNGDLSVPEPGTWSMLLTGIGLAATFRFRLQRANSRRRAL